MPMLRLLDLHCDTVTACMRAGQRLASNSLHVDLARGGRYGRWAQVFAIFVPDTLRGEAAWAYYKRALGFWRREMARAGELCPPANVAPLLAVENGSVLRGDPSRVAELAADGVRILTLTWNGPNELGSGAACDPSAPLSAAGRAAVLECWRRGVLPDVSHLNEAGFWEVDALRVKAGLDARYIASHSCCAAVRPHRRNLSDAQLRALFAADGLMGLCLYPEFLGGAGTAADALRHVEHLLALGGAERIALGSDLDGCTMHPSLAGIEKLADLRGALLADGVGEAAVEGMFWENGARVLGI